MAMIIHSNLFYLSLVSQAHTELNAAFPASFSKCVIVNVKIPFTKAVSTKFADIIVEEKSYSEARRTINNDLIRTNTHGPINLAEDAFLMERY
jgi:hypothetical protein